MDRRWVATTTQQDGPLQEPNVHLRPTAATDDSM